MEIKQVKTYGLLALILLSTIPVVVSAERPPCIAYGFTIDEMSNHSSLFRSDSTLFGTQAYVVTDCEEGVNVSVNGSNVAWTNESTSFELPAGRVNITIEGPQIHHEYNNMIAIPTGQLNHIMTALPTQYQIDAVTLSQEDLAWEKFYSALQVSGVILLFSTIFIPMLMGFIMDRRFIQEVVG